MRTSKDEYILSDGRIISLGQDENVPEEAKIWNGYDYKNQQWVHKGAKDSRPLEVLQEAMGSGKCKCAVCPENFDY